STDVAGPHRRRTAGRDFERVMPSPPSAPRTTATEYFARTEPTTFGPTVARGERGGNTGGKRGGNRGGRRGARLAATSASMPAQHTSPMQAQQHTSPMPAQTAYQMPAEHTYVDVPRGGIRGANRGGIRGGGRGGNA
ncbi:hypothetical protein MKX03_000521, partial [Papaver bracteatum]